MWREIISIIESYLFEIISIAGFLTVVYLIDAIFSSKKSDDEDDEDTDKRYPRY